MQFDKRGLTTSDNLNCTDGFFKCLSSGSCISSHWLCDGDRDCVGGEDENPSICNSKPEIVKSCKCFVFFLFVSF